MFDTVVVGAGVGGITSALLASQTDKKVLLLEQHSLLGGCSSYFRRGPYAFDVGATTLSGLLPHQPLGELQELLGLKFPVVKVDPGIHFHFSSGREISRFSDFDQWQKELQKIQASNPELWHHLEKIEAKAWKVLKSLRPFEGINSELIKKSINPDVLSLLPYFLMSAEMDLKRFDSSGEDFWELVNGVDLISAQAFAHQIPAFVGAMSLTYPKETYYPWGGMKGLMEFCEGELLKRNVLIRKKTRVIKLREEKNHLVLTTESGEEIEARKVIFNLTHWALESLLENKQQMQREVKKRAEGPAAFCVYFATRLSEPMKNLYHQVHLKNPSLTNYFISFSHPDDHSRAPRGEQTVTLSTHVDPKDWSHLSTEEYLFFKKKMTDLMIGDFQNRFTPLEIKHLTSGTPQTFESYTGRPMGMVGGLPLLYGQGPWEFLLPEVAPERIFRVGDTVFPGQGWVGVVAGALNLHEMLCKKR